VTRILFVCLGNICRSPTAEATMRALVAKAGLEHEIEVDSAGTGAWHVGDPPDERAAEAAAARGIALTGAARQVTPQDFFDFDFLVAMDRSNLGVLWELAPGEAARSKARLLREFEPGRDGAARGRALDVPDPYYGGARGFEEVLDIVDAGCRGLLEQIREEAPV
jgi:low molecular weight protein-tyrosine phosphatase